MEFTTDDLIPDELTTDDFDIKPVKRKSVPAKTVKVTAIEDPAKFERAKARDFGDVNEAYRVNVSETPAFEPRRLELVVPKGESPLVKSKPVRQEVTLRDAKLRKGEAYGSLARRQAQLVDAEKVERQRRRMAGAEAEPSRNIAERTLTGMAQGAGGVVGSAAQGLGLLAGQGLENYVDPLALPQMNPEDQKSWATMIGSGLGSAIPFGLISAVTGGTGASLLGAASQAGSTYEEALANGFEEKDAKAAATLGALVGSLEGVMGVGKGEFLPKGWVGGLKHFVKESGEEGLQEIVSQLLNNINAKVASGYDPQRALTEGLAENFAIGALVGGVFNAPGLLATTAPTQKFDPAQTQSILQGREPLRIAAQRISPVDYKANLSRFMEGSTVKDEAGEPLKVYHATTADFPTFTKTEDIGFHFGTTEAATHRIREKGTEGDYLPNAQIGSYYLSLKNPLELDADIFGGIDTTVRGLVERGVIEETPEIRNLQARQSQMPKSTYQSALRTEVVSQLKSQGYDGIKYVNNIEDKGNPSYMVFDPNQIKSTTANVGTFDTGDYRVAAQRILNPSSSDLDVAEALFEKRGPSFATPEEMEKLRNDPDLLAEVVAPYKLNLNAVNDELAEDVSREPKNFVLKVPKDPARSPILYVSEAVMVSMNNFSYDENGRISANGGASIPTSDLRRYIEDLKLIANPNRYDEIAAQLKTLETIARQRGSYSVAIVNKDRSLGAIRTTLRHENVHAGQELAARETQERDKQLFRDTLLDLHDPDWAANHPIVKKAANTIFGKGVQSDYPAEDASNSIAMELMAYLSTGEHWRFGLTTGEAVDYMLDYLEHVVEQRGDLGLAILEQTSRPRPNVKEIYGIVRESKSVSQTPAKFAGSTGSRVSAIAASRTDSPTGETGAESEGSELGGGVESEVTTDDLVLKPTSGVGAPPPPSGTGSEGLEDGGSDVPPLVQPVLNESYFRDLTKRATDLMIELGVPMDPGVGIALQLKDVIASGLVTNEVLSQAMAKHGITEDEISKVFMHTASLAGRDLQYLSEAQKRWATELERLKLRLKDASTEEEQEELKVKIKRLEDVLPARKQVKMMLDDLRASELGQTLVRRSGNLMRKMALGFVSTATNNFISTGLRLIINGAVAFPKGVAMGMLNPKKYGGASYGSLAEAAWNSGRREIQPMIETALALSPKSLKDLMSKNSGGRWAEYKQTLLELHKTYPAEYRELMGYIGGEYTHEKADADFKKIEDLLLFVNDIPDRKNLQKQLNEYKKRDKFNRTFLGKRIKNVEGFYDLFLEPLKWQELAVRYPYAVASLRIEAEKAGLDINDLIKNNDLKSLPESVIERVVSSTLETTYAYNPKGERGYTEKVAAKMIEAINAAGPVGFVVEAFPRALFNGAKFWYEFGPWGALAPGAKVARDLVEAHRAGDSMTEAVKEQHVERFAKAAVGTMMMVAAYGLRNSVGGDDWWQLKSGRKDKKGNPIYLDIRKYQPMAGFVWLADYVDRVAEGRAIDRSFREWGEVALGMRRVDATGSAFEYIDAMLKYWGDPDESMDSRKWVEAKRQAGMLTALPLTPALNLRELIGQFNEQNRRRKELKGNEFYGPALDKLPWIRTKLPDASTQTEPAPLYISEDPGLRALGFQFMSGGNFVTRELNRLGINPAVWLGRDPDPKIDAAQRLALGQMIEDEAKSLGKSQFYQSLSDPQKAAHLESIFLGGEDYDGWVKFAREEGLLANPDEALKREMKREGGNRLERRATGYDKTIDKLFEKK